MVKLQVEHSTSQVVNETKNGWYLHSFQEYCTQKHFRLNTMHKLPVWLTWCFFCNYWAMSILIKLYITSQS